MFCSILELNYKGGQKPMKKLETITTTEYKVTEVVCNGCGNTVIEQTVFQLIRNGVTVLALTAKIIALTFAMNVIVKSLKISKYLLKNTNMIIKLIFIFCNYI